MVRVSANKEEKKVPIGKKDLKLIKKLANHANTIRNQIAVSVPPMKVNDISMKEFEQFKAWKKAQDEFAKAAQEKVQLEKEKMETASDEDDDDVSSEVSDESYDEDEQEQSSDEDEISVEEQRAASLVKVVYRILKAFDTLHPESQQFKYGASNKEITMVLVPEFIETTRLMLENIWYLCKLRKSSMINSDVLEVVYHGLDVDNIAKAERIFDLMVAMVTDNPKEEYKLRFFTKIKPYIKDLEPLTLKNPRQKKEIQVGIKISSKKYARKLCVAIIAKYLEKLNKTVSLKN